jgi:hypothetical protein
MFSACLKVTCKRLKKQIRLSNFHEFWSEEVHCIKDPHKNKNLHIWTLQSHGSYGTGGWNILRLLNMKVA